MAITEVVRGDTFGIWRTKTNQISLTVGDFELLVPLTRLLVGSVSSSGTTVTGIGTTFLTDLKPGDRIRSVFNSQIVYVQQVNSDTEIITDVAFAPVLGGGDRLQVFANDIVEAINYLDLRIKFSQRRLLIHAIALN